MRVMSIVLLAGLSGNALAAEGVVFPDVGSYKLTETTYLSSDQPPRSTRQEVIRIVDNRPVFAGNIGASRGIIFESATAVVVAENECNIRPEDYPPPAVPNVCGWTPCHIELGQEIVRKVELYMRMHQCKLQHGLVTAKGLKRALLDVPGLGRVTVTETAMTAEFESWFMTFRWTASISPGFGEVLGRDSGKEMVVQDARFVPYRRVSAVVQE